MKNFCLTVFVFFFLCLNLDAQKDSALYAKNTTRENRAKEYTYLVNNSITKNLSLSLTDSTEENWQDAFMALELINYRSLQVDASIRLVFNAIEKRSLDFQRDYLELIYTNYPKEFILQIVAFIKRTEDPKLLAMCAEYLFMNNRKSEYKNLLLKRMHEIRQKKNTDKEDTFFILLQKKLLQKNIKPPSLTGLLSNTFLNNEIILFSFQRKNRNYPGLAMVRGKDGKFIKDENGNYFSVQQLARSITNMPGYLTNGNTPQGIFRMTGFDVSKGSFIGPTTNIQMVMPYEKSMEVPDSIMQSLGDNYKSILPLAWKNYNPIYESYYAGKAGRTEIIAHGTTVNPEYYLNKPYYPVTPTQGCLCTKEIWSKADGKRLISDQQKLVNALKAAGGANGYCVVIEIDDQQKPVRLSEISPYLK